MLDATQARFLVLRQRARLKEPAAEPEALRQQCLHPAERWVMQRRAGRPQAASQRLPAVARIA